MNKITHTYLGFDSFKLMYAITPRLTSLYNNSVPDCAMTETFFISSVMICDVRYSCFPIPHNGQVNIALFTPISILGHSMLSRNKVRYKCFKAIQEVIQYDSNPPYISYCLSDKAIKGHSSKIVSQNCNIKLDNFVSKLTHYITIYQLIKDHYIKFENGKSNCFCTEASAHMHICQVL